MNLQFIINTVLRGTLTWPQRGNTYEFRGAMIQAASMKGGDKNETTTNGGEHGYASSCYISLDLAQAILFPIVLHHILSSYKTAQCGLDLASTSNLFTRYPADCNWRIVGWVLAIFIYIEDLYSHYYMTPATVMTVSSYIGALDVIPTQALCGWKLKIFRTFKLFAFPTFPTQRLKPPLRLHTLPTGVVLRRHHRKPPRRWPSFSAAPLTHCTADLLPMDESFLYFYFLGPSCINRVRSL